jgi:hypothetical protein
MMNSREQPKNSEKGLLQCHFLHHDPHSKSLGIETDLRGEKSASSGLSYGTTIEMKE